MKAEEMALRSEIRQMLNEAGFNRTTIKYMVKNSIDDIVKNQVNQVLMERREQDLETVVSDYLNRNLHREISKRVESVIKDKLRWMNFDINVNIEDKSKSKET